MSNWHLFVIVLCFLACDQKTNGIEDERIGSFAGVFTHGNFSDNILFDIERDSIKWNGFFTSLAQGAQRIPFQNVIVKGDSICFTLQSDLYTFSFKSRWSENFTKLEGIMEVDTVITPYSFDKKTVAEQNNVKREELTIVSNDLLLKGTIWYPKNKVDKGLVILASSGTSDRSSSRAEAILMAQKSYITFHYDKRGTGTSEGNWQAATMEELISDDINAIVHFSQQTGIPFSEIGIMGSSQGATKIPYILNELEKLKYGIAVSCPGSTLLESDLNAWKNNNSNISEEGVELQRKVFEHIAGKIKRNELQRLIKAEESKSWFKKIWIPNLDEVQVDSKLLYSPIPYFRKTRQPILIIQGTVDRIIPKNSHEIISDALKEAYNDRYKILQLKDADHSMYHIGQADFPYWAKFHDNYLNSIDGWIQERY